MVATKYQGKVLDVKGIREAQNILNQYVGGLDKFTEKNFKEGGKVIVQSASSKTPIDTGRLVSNNKILKVNSKHLTVGNTAPYAKFVHDGTSRMRARPFYREAIETFTRRFPQLMVKDCTEFYQDLVRKNKP